MKKNNDYWVERRAQMMRENMEIAEKAADEMAKQYLNASKYVEELLKNTFNKSITGVKISDSDVNMVLKRVKEGGIDEIIKTAKAMDKTNLAAYLERSEIKRRFKELTDLHEQIDSVISTLGKTEDAGINQALKNIAEESYNKSIFSIQQQTGLGFSFNKFDQELYDKLIRSKWSGENYSKRIWKKTQSLAGTVKSELLQGFMCGKTYKEMTKVVQDKFSASAVNARRLIRTEGNYVSNEFQMQSYDECGIEQYVFVATLDLKTSEMCARLDKKIFNVKDAVPGINMPPMHPWCRSTTIAYFGDEALTNMERRARNPETGKNETVSANMTYDEWNKKYVKKNTNLEESDLSKKLEEMLIQKNTNNKIKTFRKIVKKIENKKIRTLFEQADKRVEYVGRDTRKSGYSRTDDGEKIYIGKGATDSTIAHELFHEIDASYKLTEEGLLKNSFKDDYKRLVELTEKNGKSIPDMLYSMYPDAFYADSLGQKRIHKEYRGISDILNGMSKGEINLGFYHESSYWKSDAIVQKEIFAQYGRMLYENNPETLKMAKALFENCDIEIKNTLERIVV